MEIITHEMIKSLQIPAKEYLQWIKESIKQKEETFLPPKISLKPSHDIFYNFMPTILPKENVAGVKVVNRYPERIPVLDSQLLLYDLTNGESLALLDANLITAMRTAAVAVHSIELLAIKNFSVISFIGLGNQARAIAFMLLPILKNKNVTFKILEYKDQHERFSEYLTKIGYRKLNIEFKNDYISVLEGSDVIISSATYFEEDIVESDEVFKKGVLLVPIHTRGFTLCDVTFDKVFADDTDHVRNFKYFDDFPYFAEVAEVDRGDKEGRVSESERIVVYNIGLAVHDIYFANQIYRKISNEKKNINNVLLNSINQKFWM